MHRSLLTNSLAVVAFDKKGQTRYNKYGVEFLFFLLSLLPDGKAIAC
jgi:hypothetical protein